MDRANWSHITGEQRKKLEGMLHEHTDVFILFKKDLGTFKDVKEAKKTDLTVITGYGRQGHN